MKKDKEWLREEVYKLIEGYTSFGGHERNFIAEANVNKLGVLIDQLDEPETLSEKWIENHTASADTISYYSEESVPVVTVSNLKGLLVPNQDKPAIPKFVADWYEENLSGGHRDGRNKFSGNDVFRIIQDVLETIEGFRAFENYGIYKKIATWAEENEEGFMHLIVNCSYKEGYEVEKEKLYIIKFAPSIYGTPVYGSIGMQNGEKIMQSVYSTQKAGVIPNQYTQKEIEEVGIEYMAFAEEVTE